MKVKALRRFIDLENDRAIRQIGDEWEVTKERGQELIGISFASEVKPKPKPKAKKKPAKK